MTKQKRTPKVYTREQIDKLHYTMRKPDTASGIRKDLYGPGLVTYETQLQRERKRKRAGNANHSVGENALGSGGRGGHTGHRVRRFRAGSMSSSVAAHCSTSIARNQILPED